MWDNKIKLKSEKQFTFESIYILSSKKFEELRKYSKINERKEFIRKSQSFAVHSILFMLKKDKRLRFCIDYRKLKEILIKN